MPSLFKELGTVSLAPTTDAPLGYRKCRRCSGTGFYSQHVRRAHRGVPGLCLECDGAGRIRISTPQEIADRREAKKRTEYRRNAIGQIRDIAMPRRDIRVRVLRGLERLEHFAPERFAKMLASVHAGRVQDVVDALVAYETAADEAEKAQWRESCATA